MNFNFLNYDLILNYKYLKKKMMHYSIELWGNYNNVYQQLNNHIKGLNDLIGMFVERYKANQNLAKTLNLLSESKNNITTFESLFEGILGFKGDMVNQYNYLSEFLAGLRDEIIKPLSTTYQTFSKKLNQNSTETSNIYKAYQNSVNQLEISKNKFHSSVYGAEQCKLKAEYFKKKISTINNNNELKEDYLNRLKEEDSKAMNLLKEAKENERIYISLINNTNRLQDEYIEIKNRNLNEIQDLEEELGEYIKDSLRKFIIFQVAYLRNMQYDVDKKAKIIEGINIRNDIQKFINENKSDIIPPTKFEYMPYISNLCQNNEKEKQIQNLSPEIIKEVNTFISNVFPLDRSNEVKLLKTKMQADIEEIVNKIFNSEKLNFEDTKEITRLIMNKRARRLLLTEINNYRIKNNNCLLNDNAYDTIIDILKESLKLIRNDKDFESAKMIINLSNVLYKNSNDDEEKEQIYINSNLKHEKIIKSYDFWKDLIKFNIIEEMHCHKIFNMCLDEKEKKEEENKGKIKEIILNKLKVFSKNMMNFYFRPNSIKQIIQEFKEFYQLDDKEIEEINKKIDEYENELLNKNDISTYSTEINS